MKTIFRITFYNISMQESTSDRVLNLLKFAYWNPDQAPDDWEGFDGDIEVEALESRGGDCAKVLVAPLWQKDIYTSLKKDKGIRNIEVLYTESSMQLIKDTFPPQNFPSEHLINQYVSNF